jgi:ophiobolin F synthase
MWMTVHRFGIGFALSQEERQSVAHITQSMYAAMVLVNDLYSWDVEYSNYLRKGKSLPLTNTVHMIMEWHSVSANRAKKLLKWKIRSLEKKYCSIRDRFLVSPTSTTALAKWFKILELCHAGMTLWSTTTARYNTSAPQPPTQPIAMTRGLLNPAAAGDTLAIPSDQAKILSSLEEHDSHINKNGHCMCCTTTLDEKVRALVLPRVQLSKIYKIVLEPFGYLSSLPSKGVRSAAISSLNLWYNLSEDQAQIIREIVDLMHQSSLM